MDKIYFLWPILLVSMIIAIMLSGCVIILPNNNYTPTCQWHVIKSSNTGAINCQGSYGEYGNYKYGYISIPFTIYQSSIVKINVSSNFNYLPPNNFYVLLLTQNQFQDFLLNNNYTFYDSLSHYDLTQQPFYEITQYFNLTSGKYYLLFWNLYSQYGQGVYGTANYTIDIR